MANEAVTQLNETPPAGSADKVADALIEVLAEELP